MKQMNGESLKIEIDNVVFFLFYFISNTEVRTQGFSLAKQVLYSLSHTSSSYGSGCFGDMISSMNQDPPNLHFPRLLG
jgi:hypothetical protein